MRENDERTIGRKRGTKGGNTVHESFSGGAGNERVETRPQPWPKGIESPPRGPRSGIRPSYFNILSALRGIAHTTAKRPIFEANEVLGGAQVLSDTFGYSKVHLILFGLFEEIFRYLKLNLYIK